jgi:hypothetical protein
VGAWIFFLREKVGREHSETSTVTGLRARHARIGRHCCFWQGRWVGKCGQGNTLKLQRWRGFELDMQESGVTAASDREGGQEKVGRETLWNFSTVTGIRARNARIGRHCCFWQGRWAGKGAPLVSWLLSKVGEGVLQYAYEDWRVCALFVRVHSKLLDRLKRARPWVKGTCPWLKGAPKFAW